ncbi:Gfo/Idh/MocA family oxidoreductase [Bacillus benzoevorans]|uniref:Acyl-ACP--UDP-N-acetylglucosamine O-acyltransferase n=1 Tax=Bacillus benzoevorans TaxID=1456 RepID=A0A7X0HUN0_9BACI|nr:Gfo/Idh/MocA family oxidoreductase [Bacillus benzoevorans]MBB6447153.1 acyl-ACP--UDP-N-acetylglucosamine O-acyltransferase [Bacillus benzoevorans]
MRLGLIGFGKWGPNIAKEIALNKNMRLCAICDTNEQRLRAAEDIFAKNKDVFITTNYHLLLSDKIDAIAVAVGVGNSFEIAKDILLANKHLFIEKPFAMTCEHAMDLQSIAIQRGLTIHVDHIMVFHPAIKKIKSNMVKSSPMINFESTRNTIGQYSVPAEMLWDLAVHDLAVLDYLLDGQELDVLKIDYHSNEMTLTLSCNTVLGRIRVGQNATEKERHTKISFADKEIYFDELDDRKAFTIYDKDKNENLCKPIDQIYDGPDALTSSLTHFIDCVHCRRKSISGAEQAIRCLKVMEKAEKMMKTERLKRVIHESAYIDKKAIIGERVSIGEFSIISDGVRIGDGVTISSHTKIHPSTTIGNGTFIGSFCSIGALPNLKGFDTSIESGLIIGSNNTINDHTVIARSKDPGGKTIIGDCNHIGHGAYIGHDVIIGNSTTLSAHVRISGYTRVDDFAHIGMSAFTHQFTNVGKYVMIGALAKVVRDIPPYFLVDGNPALIKKINKVGLERQGFTVEQIYQLECILKAFASSSYPSLNTQDRAKLIKQFQACEMFSKLIQFINDSKRGCTRIDV